MSTDNRDKSPVIATARNLCLKPFVLHLPFDLWLVIIRYVVMVPEYWIKHLPKYNYLIALMVIIYENRSLGESLNEGLWSVLRSEMWNPYISNLTRLNKEHVIGSLLDLKVVLSGTGLHCSQCCRYINYTSDILVNLFVNREKSVCEYCAVKNKWVTMVFFQGDNCMYDVYGVRVKDISKKGFIPKNNHRANYLWKEEIEHHIIDKRLNIKSIVKKMGHPNKDMYDQIMYTLENGHGSSIGYSSTGSSYFR